MLAIGEVYLSGGLAVDLLDALLEPLREVIEEDVLGDVDEEAVLEGGEGGEGGGREELFVAEVVAAVDCLREGEAV